MHHSLSLNEKSLIAAVDGLRGLAVLLVLLSHMNQMEMILVPVLDFSGIGKAGVYLFFVLSAWLLCFKAFQVEENSGWSSGYWAGYWIRRFFRILPLYSLVLAFSWLATRENWGVWVIRFSTEDLVEHIFMLEGRSVFWAIPVEFLFYFVLPPLLWLIVILRRKFQSKAVVCFLASLMILPVVIPWGGVYGKNSTNLWAYWPIFNAGVLLAFATRLSSFRGILQGMSAWILGLAGVAALLLVVVTIPPFTNWLASTFGTPLDLANDAFHDWILLYAFCWPLVLTAVLSGPAWMTGIFAWTPFALIGRISFSIYLLHIPVIRGIKIAGIESPLAAGWCVAIITLLMATLTYAMIEKPGINIGRLLARRCKTAIDNRPVSN